MAIWRSIICYFYFLFYVANNNIMISVQSYFYKRIVSVNSYLKCDGIGSDNIDFPKIQNQLIKKSLYSAISVATTTALFSITTLLSSSTSSVLTIPLTAFDGVLCMNYTIDGDVFRGIVDTGSPFLIVPSVCTSLWGCRAKDAVAHKQSSYSDTIEIYGGQDYSVEWKTGDLSFDKSVQNFKNIVFAEVGSDVMLPPEGQSIRPTLLEQICYNSFQLDVPNKVLRLSKKSLLKNNNNVIKMVDLRPLGDPVYHYAVPVKRLQINGKLIGEDVDIFAIFDSGTSGCVLSDELFNNENTPLPIRKVTVTLVSEDFNELIFERYATRKDIFVVTAAKIPWFNDNNKNNDRKKTEIIVLGMAFMTNKVLTIDTESERLNLENII